jgi:carbamoyltransferase
MRTEMDYLVVGDCLFRKDNQPEYADSSDWRGEYELD